MSHVRAKNAPRAAAAVVVAADAVVVMAAVPALAAVPSVKAALAAGHVGTVVHRSAKVASKAANAGMVPVHGRCGAAKGVPVKNCLPDKKAVLMDGLFVWA